MGEIPGICQNKVCRRGREQAWSKHLGRVPAGLLYGPWLLCGRGKEAGNVPRNGITSQLFRRPEATRPPRVKRGQIEHLQRSMESAEALGPGSRYEIWLCCLQAWLCPVAAGLPTHIGLVLGMAARPLPFFMEMPQFQCFCSSLTSPVGPMALSSSEAALVSPSYSNYPDSSNKLTCYICPVSACMAILPTWLTKTGTPGVIC